MVVEAAIPAAVVRASSVPTASAAVEGAGAASKAAQAVTAGEGLKTAAQIALENARKGQTVAEGINAAKAAEVKSGPEVMAAERLESVATSGVSPEQALENFAEGKKQAAGGESTAKTLETTQITGTPSEGMDLDPRYLAIQQELEAKWLADNPGQDFLSEAGQNYKMGYMAVDDKGKPTLKTDAEKEFRRRYPDDAKGYDVKEQTRIYEDLSDDPMIQAVNERINDVTVYDPRAKHIPADESHRRFWITVDRETKRAWEDFVSDYPEKAQAYAKQGHEKIVAELKRRAGEKETAQEQKQQPQSADAGAVQTSEAGSGVTADTVPQGESSEPVKKTAAEVQPEVAASAQGETVKLPIRLNSISENQMAAWDNSHPVPQNEREFREYLTERAWAEKNYTVAERVSSDLDQWKMDHPKATNAEIEKQRDELTSKHNKEYDREIQQGNKEQEGMSAAEFARKMEELQQLITAQTEVNQAVAELNTIPPNERTASQIAVLKRLVNQQKEINANIIALRAELRVDAVVSKSSWKPMLMASMMVAGQAGQALEGEETKSK